MSPPPWHAQTQPAHFRRRCRACTSAMPARQALALQPLTHASHEAKSPLLLSRTAEAARQAAKAELQRLQRTLLTTGQLLPDGGSRLRQRVAQLQQQLGPEPADQQAGGSNPAAAPDSAPATACSAAQASSPGSAVTDVAAASLGSGTRTGQGQASSPAGPELPEQQQHQHQVAPGSHAQPGKPGPGAQASAPQKVQPHQQPSMLRQALAQAASQPLVPAQLPMGQQQQQQQQQQLDKEQLVQRPEVLQTSDRQNRPDSADGPPVKPATVKGQPASTHMRLSQASFRDKQQQQQQQQPGQDVAHGEAQVGPHLPCRYVWPWEHMQCVEDPDLRCRLPLYCPS